MMTYSRSDANLLRDQATIKQVFRWLRTASREEAPRGEPTLELENVHLLLHEPVRSCWLTYPSRKLSFDYIKKELAWYLKGDDTDLSITEHSKIWGPIVQNGRLNSNYGRAWFAEQQLQRCYEYLRADPATRRATVLIPHRDMFDPWILDVPCTVYQSFRLRDGRLNASTHMRSQDAIFGLGNDLPAFVLIQDLLAAALGVPVGTHSLSVDSFHVYQRHWDMLGRIVTEEPEPYERPRPSQDEAIDYVNVNGYVDITAINGPFTDWLRGDRS